MIVLELMLYCVLTTTGSNTHPDEYLATVRHFSRSPEPQWTFTVREAADGRASAHLWWIVGETPTLESEELTEARVADVDVATCPAIGEIAARMKQLAVPRKTTKSQETDRPSVLFDLATPGNPLVDLAQLAPDHPLVQWATRSWKELSACAAAN